MSEDAMLRVDPGACRFKGTVVCTPDDGKVLVNIDCECPYVKKLSGQIKDLTLEEIIQMPFCDNRVYIEGGKLLKHSVCPYPMAILKCAEHTAGIALKKDIVLEYKKD